MVTNILREEISAIYLFAKNCELENKTLAQNHPSWLMLGEKQLLPVGLVDNIEYLYNLQGAPKFCSWKDYGPDWTWVDLN